VAYEAEVVWFKPAECGLKFLNKFLSVRSCRRDGLFKAILSL